MQRLHPRHDKPSGLATVGQSKPNVVVGTINIDFRQPPPDQNRLLQLKRGGDQEAPAKKLKNLQILKTR
jgi:hypothetical protein